MNPHDAPPTIRDLFVSNDPADQRWRAHLAALPDVDPPAALWERLQQARAEQTMPRRARWPWMASAAALAVAVLATQLLPQQHAAAPAGSELVQVPSIESADPASRASLLRMDAELARAFEQNADDARLDALWQARSNLVDSLATAAPAELVQL